MVWSRMYASVILADFYLVVYMVQYRQSTHTQREKKFWWMLIRHQITKFNSYQIFCSNSNIIYVISDVITKYKKKTLNIAQYVERKHYVIDVTLIASYLSLLSADGFSSSELVSLE